MLKDELFKTSGLQFDNRLLGSENFLGLSRNTPQMFRIHTRTPDQLFLFPSQEFFAIFLRSSGGSKGRQAEPHSHRNPSTAGITTKGIARGHVRRICPIINNILIIIIIINILIIIIIIIIIIIRGPSDGASMSHTNPWSQSFPE